MKLYELFAEFSKPGVPAWNWATPPIQDNLDSSHFLRDPSHRGGRATSSVTVRHAQRDDYLMLVSSSAPVPMSPEYAALTSPTPLAYHADIRIDISVGRNAPDDA